MPVLAQTTVLVILSNAFMTFAWYAHLKHLGSRTWFFAALTPEPAKWLPPAPSTKS